MSPKNLRLLLSITAMLSTGIIEKPLQACCPSTCSTSSCPPASCSSSANCSSSCYPPSIFIPRQLSYNPIFENALVLDKNGNLECWDWIFSGKPIYTQNVGKKFTQYFNINNLCSLNVQENGTGNVDSLWFQDISTDPTMYSSTLTFAPKRQTYGAMLYFALELPHDFELSFNTAVVKAKNNMNICERCVDNLGTVTGYLTITQAFANPTLLDGRIAGCVSQVGADDLQIKLIRHLSECDANFWDIYALVGVPTGKGSNAINLFEPIVGSNHVQFGLGTDGKWDLADYDCGTFSLLGELKWRYGFSANECRSFDLCPNGQWSRYLLLVSQSALYTPFQAINVLTFQTNVTPRNSLDLYLAAHWGAKNWNFEVGYDFWYRQAEKVCLTSCAGFATPVGIADLPGIAARSPQTASTANISQGVLPNSNTIVSDATFIPLTLSNINLLSGAQPQGISNSVYASIGHYTEWKNCETQIGVNVAYEGGAGVNTPDNVTVWLDLELFV